MDAIDILGSLLGQKSGGGGLGGKILKDLLGGGGRAPQAAPPTSGGNAPRGGGRSDVDISAQDLEDLLNVATGRARERSASGGAPPGPLPRAPQPTSPTAPPSRAPQPQPQPVPTPRVQRPMPAPPAPAPFPPRRPGQACDPGRQNDQAVILIRAMVNAAKADGEICEQEQQNMLQQIGQPTQETIDFLRQEFAAPCDVRDFAWSVPLGLEEQVYSISLMTMSLDTEPEASYLRELAHGLRIPPEVCNQIHQRYQAPLIFS